MDEVTRKKIAKEVAMVTRGMAIGNRLAKVSGKRISIPLPGRKLMAVYYPVNRPNAPMIFAFHGGGYVFGGCALDDNLYVGLREALDANVISVGYRKAPKYKFPIPQEDCYDAVKYFMENTAYDFDRSRTAVYGGSAGANAAMAVTTLAKARGGPKVGMRILTYPFCDAFTHPAEKPGVMPQEVPMYEYFNEVGGTPADAKNPVVSPYWGTAEELDTTTPTIAILAEKDSLNSEGRATMEKLQGAGCDVEIYDAAGMPHGFFEFGFASPKDKNVDYLPEVLKQARADGTLTAQKDWSLEKIKAFWKKHFA